MKIGFIGLGNVGGKLAGNLIRNGKDLSIHDLDTTLIQKFVDLGAQAGATPKKIAQTCDVIITCLPSPSASVAVLQGQDGVLSGISEGKIWAEMSTTDAQLMQSLTKVVAQKGGSAIECPVSGGCHRAATGNISIFAGCERSTFDRMLPILTILGRRVLHTGPIGTASMLKVMTNYLATANLITLAEALATMKAAGMNLASAYEAIVISSGTSFVAETEGQVILNGSRDISFTMDLVKKDIGLFQAIAEQHQIGLEVSPLMIDIFNDGIAKYGSRELSPNIIKRWEDAAGLSILADGFPAEMVDTDPPAPGYEVIPRNRQ